MSKENMKRRAFGIWYKKRAPKRFKKFIATARPKLAMPIMDP
jgi:hypothetical protein